MHLEKGENRQLIMSKKRRVHQFLSGFTYGDAISDYAIEIQHIFRSKGYESEIYCEYMDARLKGGCKKFAYYLDDKEDTDIAILHYSIGSSIVPFVYEEAPNVVIIYHNITPHYYFAEINPYLYKECLAGRKWLGLFRDKAVVAIADSEYNRKELVELGFNNTRVLPIKIDFRKFDKDYSFLLADKYRDKRSNLLFIGRIIPNKKVEHVIMTYYAYKRYFNNLSRLFIVGGYIGYERYYYGLRKLIEGLKLKDVIFTGHISATFLSAILRVADVFIMLSEHEGFCVPLLEAMYRGVVVVGLERGAIPYTMRGGGILVKRKDFLHIAALIDEVMNDRKLRDAIIEEQMEVIRMYKEYDFEGELFYCLKGLIW